ncbi:MAG: Fic family protein [Candidatus Izemoplasmatales bacterium]|jgi:Fic family protein
MSVIYKGLFNNLENKEITLSKLCDDLNISSATRAKFKKGEYVSLQTIESICKYLNLNFNDIVSFDIINNPSPLLRRLKEEMQYKIKGGIYHETQILMTYNSNHIEGSKLTADQTRYIFETNTIGLDKDKTVNVDDVIETLNHFKCIDYMIKTALEPISETLIKDLHKILKTGTSDSKLDWFKTGDYKRRPNTVGGIETSKPKDVEEDMISLIGLYENKQKYSFEDIIEFHYNFERIHPFQDGNGRVGRLIAFKECLRHGYVPFTIDEDTKLFYYRGLKQWEIERGYLMDTCLTGQDKYKMILDVLEIDYE